MKHLLFRLYVNIMYITITLSKHTNNRIISNLLYSITHTVNIKALKIAYKNHYGIYAHKYEVYEIINERGWLKWFYCMN